MFSFDKESNHRVIIEILTFGQKNNISFGEINAMNNLYCSPLTRNFSTLHVKFMRFTRSTS